RVTIFLKLVKNLSQARLFLATTAKEGGSAGFASLHGSNLLEQCRSNCRGAKTKRLLSHQALNTMHLTQTTIFESIFLHIWGVP
ncbi:MAG: hypothetical protein L3J52_07615, partial [Proteobacteria bacterium]|nr:hypothetical protein [Pseudomonadota bacterium]